MSKKNDKVDSKLPTLEYKYISGYRPNKQINEWCYPYSKLLQYFHNN